MMTVRELDSIYLRHLIYYIWALPVLWVIGGERLLAPMILIVLSLGAIRPIHRMPRVLFFFLLFLMACLFSVIQVSSLERYLTFFWDFSIYLSLFLVAWALSRKVKSYEAAELLLKHMVLVMFVFNLMAFSYFFVGSIKFNTLMGYLLPGSIKATAVGSKIAVHSLGRDLWFVGINTRLGSIFMSSMQYAAALQVILPISLYFLVKSKGVNKLFYLSVVASMLVALVFSQGRTAIVLSSAAILVYALLVPFSHMRQFSSISMAFLLVLLGLPFAFFILIFSQDIYHLYETYFLETRASSAEERFQVYTMSISEILRSPVFGYGTQTTVDDLTVPLGSHNWYLAVLFKHGLLGFIPFSFFILLVQSVAFQLMFVSRKILNGTARLLGVTLFVSAFFHAILCLTAEPVVDATHVLIISVVYGLSLALIKLSRGRSGALTQRLYSN
jgi:O-antigen ligase